MKRRPCAAIPEFIKNLAERERWGGWDAGRVTPKRITHLPPTPVDSDLNIKASIPSQMQFPPRTYFILLKISTAPQTLARRRCVRARNVTYTISSISSTNVLCWQSHTAVCVCVCVCHIIHQTGLSKISFKSERVMRRAHAK